MHRNFVFSSVVDYGLFVCRFYILRSFSGASESKGGISRIELNWDPGYLSELFSNRFELNIKNQ